MMKIFLYAKELTLFTKIPFGDNSCSHDGFKCGDVKRVKRNYNKDQSKSMGDIDLFD